MKDLILTHTK